MSRAPAAPTATEVRGRIHQRVRHNRAGSGIFHPLTSKAKRRLAQANTPLPAAVISDKLWSLDQRALARLELSEDGRRRLDDPTAWDALFAILTQR
jgi:hypothetical protein